MVCFLTYYLQRWSLMPPSCSAFALLCIVSSEDAADAGMRITHIFDAKMPRSNLRRSRCAYIGSDHSIKTDGSPSTGSCSRRNPKRQRKHRHRRALEDAAGVMKEGFSMRDDLRKRSKTEDRFMSPFSTFFPAQAVVGGGLCTLDTRRVLGRSIRPSCAAANL